MKGGACGSSQPPMSSLPRAPYDDGAVENLIAAEQNGEQFPRITAVVAGEDLDLAARRPHTIVVARAVLVSSYRGLKLNSMLDAPGSPV